MTDPTISAWNRESYLLFQLRGFREENERLRGTLVQPEQEPVEYQMRTRPTWEVTSWSDWKKCSRDSAGDYAKTPKLHDWEYETRKLYTTPPKREWIGLTDVEWEAMYDKFAKYQEYGAFASGWDKFTRAIEAKLKELNHGL